MRKILLSFFAIFVLVVALGSYVQSFAQENLGEKIRKDYELQVSQYNEAYKEFVAARESYRKFRTLSSSEEVLDKGRGALLARSDVLDSYFEILSLGLAESPGLSSEIKDLEAVRIKSNREFIEANKSEIANSKNLTQLLSKSNDFEKRQAEFFASIYSSLARLLVGKVSDFQRREDLWAKSFETQLESDDATADRDEKARGIAEVNKITADVGGIIQSADKLFVNFSPEKIKFSGSSGSYGSIVKLVSGAKILLVKGAQFLVELSK